MPQPKQVKKSHKKTAHRRRTVLLDAGPIIGLYKENDEWHARCEKFFGETSNFTYVVTPAVIVEAVYYIQKERNVGTAVDAVVSLLDDVANGIYVLHRLDAAAVGRIKNLRLKYKDHKKLEDMPRGEAGGATDRRNIGVSIIGRIEALGRLPARVGDSVVIVDRSV